MVSSDDERDGSLRFGWRSQQRMRERERREKQKEERKRKEREAEEEREMEASVAGRITSGDLRERVVAQVIERLKADDVQARLKKQVDSARAAKRQALLSAVEEEGDAAVREARRRPPGEAVRGGPANPLGIGDERSEAQAKQRTGRGAQRYIPWGRRSKDDGPTQITFPMGTDLVTVDHVCVLVSSSLCWRGTRVEGRSIHGHLGVFPLGLFSNSPPMPSRIFLGMMMMFVTMAERLNRTRETENSGVS